MSNRTDEEKIERRARKAEKAASKIWGLTRELEHQMQCLSYLVGEYEAEKRVGDEIAASFALLEDLGMRWRRIGAERHDYENGKSGADADADDRRQEP